jgi:hypothetical protein
MEANRGKIQNCFNARSHHLVQNALSNPRRHGNNCDVDSLFLYGPGDSLDVVDHDLRVADPGSDLILIGVKQGNNSKIGLRKSVIVSQRDSQVSGTKNPDPMRSVQAQDFCYMSSKFFDKISDSPDPKFTKISEVLANLGGIQTELIRKGLRRNSLNSRRRKEIQAS